MFSRTARLYDALYSFKDYAVEAARVAEEIRRRFGGARTLLDVACGTGKHLEFLRAHFEVSGVDLDEHLLEIARRRMPDVPFVEADMVVLSLGKQFDAVTCLFSSIGYTLTLERMRAAIAAMAAHLVEGGVLVVEPWLTPETFEAGHVGALLVEEPGVTVARVNSSTRAGAVSTLVFHYLIGAPGSEIAHEVEEHRLGLFTEDEYRGAFIDAGLDVEHDPEGLTGRGLYLGVKGSAP